MKAYFFPLALVAICLSACNQTPDSEVQTARSAIAAARKLGAEQSAPVQLSQSARLLDSALQEIENQGKSMIGRDYAVAKKLLLEAGAMAQEAGMRAASGAKPIDSLSAKAAAVVASKPDSAAKDSAAGISAEKPTLEAAEAKVNRAYALYQKPPKQPNGVALAATEREKSMVDLKAAKAAIKIGDFAGAIRLAAQAEARLTGSPPTEFAKP